MKHPALSDWSSQLLYGITWTVLVQFASLSVYPFVYLSVCHFVHQSVYMFVCLKVLLNVLTYTHINPVGSVRTSQLTLTSDTQGVHVTHFNQTFRVNNTHLLTTPYSRCLFPLLSPPLPVGTSPARALGTARAGGGRPPGRASAQAALHGSL